jgi:hypothetical protein
VRLTSQMCPQSARVSRHAPRTAVCCARALQRPGLMEAADSVVPDVVSSLVASMLAVLDEMTFEPAAWRASASHLQPAAAVCLRWVRTVGLPAYSRRCTSVPLRHSSSIEPPELSVRTKGMLDRATGRQLGFQKACSNSWPCAMLGASHTWRSQAGLNRTQSLMSLLGRLVHSQRLWAAVEVLLVHGAACSVNRARQRAPCVTWIEHTHGLAPLPAEEGLPGAEPLLLQHLDVCRASLQADCTAEIRGVAPMAAPMGVATGVSQWALVLSDTLQTLRLLWGSKDTEVSDGAVTAVLHASMQLIKHEIATREPLPLAENETNHVDSDARLSLAAHTCLRLRGAAAAAAQRCMLQEMAEGLAIVGAKVTVALTERATAGASRAATAAMPRSDDADPDQAAITIATEAMSNSAYCIARVNAICVSSQGPQFVLAPDCDSGRAWAASIAAALATVASCFQLVASDISNNVLLAAFSAASCLAGAAVALLRRRVAAGLEALQQEASVQLVEALAAYVACESRTLFEAATLVRSCFNNGVSHHCHVVSTPSAS